MKISLIISEAQKTHEVESTLVSAGKGKTKVVVTKIDNTTYSGSAGNNALRSLMNQPLSKKQINQRKSANTKAKVGKTEKKKLQQHNIRMKKLKGPTVSIKKYRQRKQYTSKKEVWQQLNSSERHKTGWAYPSNVTWFMKVINDSAISAEWSGVYDFLNNNINFIPDDALNETHQMFYDALNSYQNDTTMSSVYSSAESALSLLENEQNKMLDTLTVKHRRKTGFRLQGKSHFSHKK